jgi:hypothetical protein
MILNLNLNCHLAQLVIENGDTMRIPITKELISICNQINDKGYSIEQWKDIESSDMFQTEQFCGGFDADESEFCFSYFAEDRNEYWFQFTLLTAKEITNGINTPELIGVLHDKVQVE